MEIIKIELDKNKNEIFGIKSPVLWGYTNKNHGSPILYLRKPKHMSEKEFNDILDRLEITLKPEINKKNNEKYIKSLREEAKKSKVIVDTKRFLNKVKCIHNK